MYDIQEGNNSNQVCNQERWKKSPRELYLVTPAVLFSIEMLNNF